MNVAARLAAFAVVLVVCFAGAFAVGTAVGPIDGEPSAPQHSGASTTVVGDPTTEHRSEHGG